MDREMNNPSDMYSYVEIMNKQLYFAVVKSKYTTKLKSTMDTFFFSIDSDFIYENYYCDFGPLNISCVYKYCCKLKKYLQYAKGLKRVVHYTSSCPEKKTNAACLMGLFCVIVLKFHPKDVWRLLQEVGPYRPFVDASQFPCGFNLKIIDCLQAMSKCLTFHFVNFEDFNVAEYDLHDKLQYGDMNWLVPRKFLAFIGPADNRTAHPPEFYLKYFLKNDIKTVIRLNTIIYDSSVFTQVGIEHYDLIFPDGTTPPKDILLRFLNISEMATAAIAVHCKAGLGRTGSLIGAYLIKHYHLSAKEAIAWMRFCRPGSVIGQQQIWLQKLESWLWRLGHQYRATRYGDSDKIPKHKYGIYSKFWPKERERIINEARKRLQKTLAKSHLDKLTKQKRISASLDMVTAKEKHEKLCKRYSDDINSHVSVTELLSSIQMDVNTESDTVRVLSVDPLHKKLLFSNALNNDNAKDLTIQKACKSAENKQRTFSGLPKWKNLGEYSKIHLPKENIGTNVITQGDKLNEIKSNRLSNKMIAKGVLKESKTFDLTKF